MTRIIPSIDILGGQCVRLRQGRFDDVMHTDSRPLDRLTDYVLAGAQEIHIVDLEGARSGSSEQLELVCSLIRSVPVEVGVGGGIRTLERAKKLLDAGASRIVVGSLAATKPDEMRQLIDEFGDDKVTVAVDFRQVDGVARPATEAWTRLGDVTIFDVVARFADLAQLRFLCTDITRDGMSGGVAVDVYSRIAASLPPDRLVASGGYRNRDDLEACRALGLHGVIVGSALFKDLSWKGGGFDAR